MKGTKAGEWTIWFLAALVMGSLGVLWIQGARLRDPYTVEEDARSFHWWQQLGDGSGEPTPVGRSQLRETALGPFTVQVYAKSPGYSLLFQAVSPLVDPLTFSKFLAFPLLALALFYLFRIGLMLRGPGTAFALCMAFVIFTLSSATDISVLGGLQRSFAMPFLLAMCYYLMGAQFQRAAVVVFLSGVIYGPAMVLGAATYGLSLLRPGKMWRDRIAWRQLLLLMAAIGLAALFLWPAIEGQLLRSVASPGTSETVSDPRLVVDPRWLEGGRRALFDYFPLIGRGGIATYGGTVLHIFLLSVLALVQIWVRPRSLITLPPTLKWLFLAGVLCFAAAWILLLLTGSYPLYLPSRYTSMALPIFLLIYVVVGLRDTLRELAAKLQRRRTWVVGLVVPAAMLAVVLAVFGPGPGESYTPLRILLVGLGSLALLLGAFTMLRKGHTTVQDKGETQAQRKLSRRGWLVVGNIILLFSLLYVQMVKAEFYVASDDERALYAYLEKLPSDTLIWGSPCTIDAVPVLVGRSILFSCEDPHGDQMLMLAALEAYYAKDLEKTAAFCEQQGIDLLVVNEEDFTNEQLASGEYFYEPFDSYLAPTLSEQREFAVMGIARDERLFEAENLFVVGCEGLGG